MSEMLAHLIVWLCTCGHEILGDDLLYVLLPRHLQPTLMTVDAAYAMHASARAVLPRLPVPMTQELLRDNGLVGHRSSARSRSVDAICNFFRSNIVWNGS
jgi:hypothetical protein